MRTHAYALLASCALAAAMLCTVMLAGCNGTPESAEHKLDSISYTYCRSEVGETVTYVLTRKNDSAAALSVRKTPPESNTGTTFEIDISAIDRAEEICEKNAVFGWPEDAPASDIEALDADERIFELTLSDGSVRRFSDLDKLPSNGKTVVSSLSQLIEDLVDID